MPNQCTNIRAGTYAAIFYPGKIWNLPIVCRLLGANLKIIKHILLNKRFALVLRLKLFDAVVSPAILFGLATLPLIKGCLSINKLGWQFPSTMRSGGIFKIKLPRCSLLRNYMYSSCDPTLVRKVWSPSERMNNKLKNVRQKLITRARAKMGGQGFGGDTSALIMNCTDVIQSMEVHLGSHVVPKLFFMVTNLVE